jgi:hypothetical protein
MSKPQLAGSVVARATAKPSFAVDDSVHVLSLVEGLATAEVGTCCALLWRGAVTEARFQLQKEAMEHLTGLYPGEASIICVIEPASEPPNQELRQKASKLLTELGPKIRCVAFVVEGNGFRAAMIRGVLSSVELLKRDKSYPTRYFGHVAHAATWIETQTTQPATGIASGVAYMRQRMDSLYQVRRSLRASAERPSVRRF